MSQEVEVSQQPEAENDDNALVKKPYEEPILFDHGTIEKLTQNVGQGFLDFPQGSSIAP